MVAKLHRQQARRVRRHTASGAALGAILAAVAIGTAVGFFLSGSLPLRSAATVATPPTGTAVGAARNVPAPSETPSAPVAQPAADLGPPAPKVGSPAPAIRASTVDGSTLDLDQLRGRVVLLNFWASWCKPCEAEMADLQELHTEQAPRGFTVIAVNEGEEPARAAEFLRAKGITFPTGLDLDMKITRDYQVLGLPNTFLIDADGVIRDRVVGPLTLDQMRARVAKVLEGHPVERPRLVSVWAAMAAENDRPAGEVLGTIVTLGEVNRRVDLENALGVLRGGVAPDYSTDEGRTLLREQQRAMGERLIDERIVAARARTVGLAVPNDEVEADTRRLADEAGLDPAGLERELAAMVSDIALLREAQRQARLIGSFTLDYVLTGRTPERIAEPDAWLESARRAAAARVLLP